MVVCPFVFFRLANALSVLRFTCSDYQISGFPVIPFVKLYVRFVILVYTVIHVVVACHLYK
jgi:heme O synthase-like polyprenyltransferase